MEPAATRIKLCVERIHERRRSEQITRVRKLPSPRQLVKGALVEPQLSVRALFEADAQRVLIRPQIPRQAGLLDHIQALDAVVQKMMLRPFDPIKLVKFLELPGRAEGWLQQFPHPMFVVSLIHISEPT